MPQDTFPFIQLAMLAPSVRGLGLLCKRNAWWGAWVKVINNSLHLSLVFFLWFNAVDIKSFEHCPNVLYLIKKILLHLNILGKCHFSWLVFFIHKYSKIKASRQFSKIFEKISIQCENTIFGKFRNSWRAYASFGLKGRPKRLFNYAKNYQLCAIALMKRI